MTDKDTETKGNLVEMPQRKREPIVVSDPIPVLDTGRFDQMYRIAKAMAQSTLLPETLCTVSEEVEGSSKKQKVLLPFETIVANAFLVVNQAVRWGMDPFGVAQCCSVVHGRLMYEGKLVAAVIDAKAGVKLDYTFGTWDPATERVDTTKEGKGDSLGVIVSGILPDSGTQAIVEGSVGSWKTTGTNSPWRIGNFKRQLRYRGAREWARAHTPALMLGVYTDDEMMDLADNARGLRSHVINESQRVEDKPRLSLADRLRSGAGKADDHPSPVETGTEAATEGLSENATGATVDGKEGAGGSQVAPEVSAAVMYGPEGAQNASHSDPLLASVVDALAVVETADELATVVDEFQAALEYEPDDIQRKAGILFEEKQRGLRRG